MTPNDLLGFAEHHGRHPGSVGLVWWPGDLVKAVPAKNGWHIERIGGNRKLGAAPICNLPVFVTNLVDV